MAFDGPSWIKLAGVTASADLSAKQFYFVKISGAGTVTVCAGTTDKPVGVLQNTPKSGQAADVLVCGQTKVSADAALTAGNVIGTSADGQAAAYAAGSDTTKYLVGQVLVGTSAAAELATAVVNCAAPARGA